MPTILFVCTANRYRSPIAAACFQRELEVRKPAGRWHVASAGTWTANGLPAMPDAIDGAHRLGLDIARHASREITSGLMSTADLILVMEQGQKEALKAEFPRSAHKVYLLTEATAGYAYNILDPVMSALDAEEDVPGEISKLIGDGFDRICSLAVQEQTS